MEWSTLYTGDHKPTLAEISSYINNPFWEELCGFIEQTCSVMPQIEYSKCSMARGWNVKYKKGSKSICTIYPNQNYFTCLLVVGKKGAMEAEVVLLDCDPYVKQLYQSIKLFNGSRWLMIDVANRKILDDVKKLICIRLKSNITHNK